MSKSKRTTKKADGGPDPAERRREIERRIVGAAKVAWAIFDLQAEVDALSPEYKPMKPDAKGFVTTAEYRAHAHAENLLGDARQALADLERQLVAELNAIDSPAFKAAAE